MIAHDTDFYLMWCKRCGRPEIEIVEDQRMECDGLRGVIHARYIEAKAHHDRVMQPMIDQVMGLLSQQSSDPR